MAVSLLTVMRAKRHKLEVDRVVCVPFSSATAPPTDSDDCNLYTGVLVEAEAHALDSAENGFQYEAYAHLLDPLLFHIQHVMCGGHETEQENALANTVTLRWLSDMVRGCANPRMCMVYVGGQRIGKSWLFDTIRKFMIGSRWSAVYDNPRDITGVFTKPVEGVIFNQFEELNVDAKGLLNWLKNFIGGQDLGQRLHYEGTKEVSNTGRSVITIDDVNKIPFPKDKCEEYDRIFISRCSTAHKTEEYIAQLVECGTRAHMVALYRYLFHYLEVDPVPFTSVGTSNAVEYIKKYTTSVQYSDKLVVREFLSFIVDEKPEYLADMNARNKEGIPTRDLFEEFLHWATKENLECAKRMRHSQLANVIVDLLRDTGAGKQQSSKSLIGFDGKPCRPNVFVGLTNEAIARIVPKRPLEDETGAKRQKI